MAEIRRPDDMVRITTKELAEAFIEKETARIREQVGNRKVLLALSGGVDSSVVAAMLIKTIGDQLTCVHVNHGLLRKGEPEQVIKVFRDEMNANLIYVDATERFLGKLAGVSDPETKRKIIGGAFLKRLAHLLAAHIIPVPERIINQRVQLRHVHLALSVQHPLLRRRVHNLPYHTEKASLLQHIGQLALHHQRKLFNNRRVDMAALYRGKTRTGKLVRHLMAGNYAEVIRCSHMRLIRYRHGKGLCL